MFSRAEWEAEADRWLLTARKHAVGGGALICPPGPVSQSGPVSDGMEGFARSFLIAAARLGGGEGDPLGHAEWYAEGLAAAVDPASGGFWPRAVGFEDWPHAGITQSAVEAANLAFGLALCREQVWDQLPDPVRERLADWLAHHARLRVWQHNNWLLFPAVVEAFLESVGVPVDGGHGAENVERIDSWYLGDGWYNDGPPAAPGRNLDHYNSWVFQPFLWQWYVLRGESGARVERFRERLSEFASSYALLFGDDGAPLHLGRSLAYRHAVLGGLWTAGLAGADPLGPGVVRGIAGRTLDYFRRLGVDGAEAPSLGWGAREFLPVVQEYSGPGSAYFAGMGFLGLAAPASHPLWSASASASASTSAPSDTPAEDSVTFLPSLGWAVQRGLGDGIVRVVNHGSDHANYADDPGDPHYAKFAYSTRTAPGTGAAWSDRAWATGVDGHVALVDEWGRATRRGRIMGVAAGEGYVASWHVPRLGASGRELAGARIVTASLVTARYELRCHLVTAPAGWSLREGGHAVASDAEVECGADALTAWAVGGGVRSSVSGVFGYEASAVVRYEDANALGRHSAAPYLSAGLSSAESVHVALHVLEAADTAPDTAPDLDPAGLIDVRGNEVTARWPGGSTVSVDLGSLFASGSTDAAS
ncbi:hypothetical protein ABIA35_006094 [Catenulispora sp. MAP12-49]|uniref:DUF2264 domain-containing protein n=1 Tax=Catenulispora sp. MAP12-49 TaxID=3156302 RepID=UPI0035180DB5